LKGIGRGRIDREELLDTCVVLKLVASLAWQDSRDDAHDLIRGDAAFPAVCRVVLCQKGISTVFVVAPDAGRDRAVDGMRLVRPHDNDVPLFGCAMDDDPDVVIEDARFADDAREKPAAPRDGARDAARYLDRVIDGWCCRRRDARSL